MKFDKKKKKGNSHKLVVPANTFWYIGFSDTDRLWRKETGKQRQRKSQFCGAGRWKQQEWDNKHDFKKGFSLPRDLLKAGEEPWDKDGPVVILRKNLDELFLEIYGKHKATVLKPSGVLKLVCGCLRVCLAGWVGVAAALRLLLMWVIILSFIEKIKLSGQRRVNARLQTGKSFSNTLLGLLHWHFSFNRFVILQWSSVWV